MDKALSTFRKGLAAATNVHPDHFLLDIRDRLKSLEQGNDFAPVFDLRLRYHTWDVKDRKCNKLRWNKKRPTHTASLNFGSDSTRPADWKEGKRKVRIWRQDRKKEIIEVEEEIDVDAPIVEVGVRFDREPPIEGFSPIRKTVAGNPATTNKGARNACTICVKYIDKKIHHLKPITGIQVSEETTVVNNPVLFKGIPLSITGRYPANVNRGTQGPSVFLSVSRGSGPPLTRLGMVVVQQELVPSSSMQVAYASSTAPAVLNPGHKHESLYLCHQSDISGVMTRAKVLCESMDEQNFTPKMRGFFGLIVAAVHCNFSQMVITALHACDLAQFPHKLEHFVYEAVAERTPCYVGQFSVVERSEIAYFLCNNVMKYANGLLDSKYSSVLVATRRGKSNLSKTYSSSADAAKHKLRSLRGLLRIPSPLIAKLLAAILALDDSLSVNVNIGNSNRLRTEAGATADRRASTIPSFNSTTAIGSSSGGHELDESLKALMRDNRSAFTALVKYLVQQLETISAIQSADKLKSGGQNGQRGPRMMPKSSFSRKVKLKGSLTRDHKGEHFAGRPYKIKEAILEEVEDRASDPSEKMKYEGKDKRATYEDARLQKSKEDKSLLKVAIKDIVQNLAESVSISKSLSSLESSFLSHDRISSGLCRHVSSAVDIALCDEFTKLVFMTMMLLAKRIQVGSSYYAPSARRHSYVPSKEGSTTHDPDEKEEVGLHTESDFISKDVLASVVNLRRLLESNGDLLTSVTPAKYLMRRFVFVGIVELCASPWHRRFKPALGLFLIFHRKYRDFMPTEIGVMLDYIFLPMLTHPLSEQLDRRIFLNVIRGITVSNKWREVQNQKGDGGHKGDRSMSSFIDLYYNYDNHLSWPNPTVVSIFKSLRAVVLKEVDENQAAITSLHGFKAQLEVRWLQEKAITVLGDMIQQLVEFAGMEIEADSRTGLRRWKSLVPTKSHAESLQKENEEESASSKPNEAAKSSFPKYKLNESNREDSCTERREMKASKKRQYAKAHDKFRDLFHSEDANLKAKAVRYACKYLVRVGMGEPYQIADFLFSYSSKMNKVQIADYLAMGGKENEFHSEVRRYYMAKIDLTQVDFAKAFRIFVCDSGFHVGGLEAQRLNRMSECFAEVYLRDNPDCGIHEVYGADALAQSLLFIHTVKFNKANDPKQGGPKLPTSSEYASMMRGQNKRYDEEKKTFIDDDFPARFLERQYNEILSKEIGINKDVDMEKSKAQKKRRKRNVRHVLRDIFSKNVRRAYAMLSSNAASSRTYLPSKNKNLAAVLLDEVGFEIYTICNDITERVALNPDTVGMIKLCLEVCMKVIAVCIELDQRELLKWMLDVAGKRAWALKVLEERGPTILDRDPVINDAEAKNQSKFKTLFWFKNIRLNFSKGRKEEAKQIILEEISRMHVKLNQLSHQTALGKLQRSFRDTHVILAPQRVFIMKENLQKVSESRKKTQDYTFFLFNDILVYANEKSTETFSIHRVLHLALCRLDSIDDTHFRVCSSQKSFTIRAPSKKICSKWITALNKYIDEQIKATGQSTVSEHESQRQARATSNVVQESDGEAMRGQSPKHSRGSFLSFTSSSLKLSARNSDERKGSILLKHGEWVCTLCLKKQGRRTRRVKCTKCEIVVCKSCAHRKVAKKLVCDSCFGQFEMKFPGSASMYGSTNTNTTMASQFVVSKFSNHHGSNPSGWNLPVPSSAQSLRTKSVLRKGNNGTVTASNSATTNPNGKVVQPAPRQSVILRLNNDDPSTAQESDNNVVDTMKLKTLDVSEPDPNGKQLGAAGNEPPGNWELDTKKDPEGVGVKLDKAES